MLRPIVTRNWKPKIMNEEISHVVQWIDLKARATNFGLLVVATNEGFQLSAIVPNTKSIATYPTLADLRAGISDYVSAERQAGRMKF